MGHDKYGRVQARFNRYVSSNLFSYMRLSTTRRNDSLSFFLRCVFQGFFKKFSELFFFGNRSNSISFRINVSNEFSSCIGYPECFNDPRPSIFISKPESQRHLLKREQIF